MINMPNISDAEWEVMRVLWKGEPMTSQKIIDETKQMNWHPKTVRTLIKRLVKKGAVSFKREGRIYIYHHIVEEKDCVTEHSQTLLDRLFAGSITPMVAHFVESKKLSKKEIKELRNILNLQDDTNKN